MILKKKMKAILKSRIITNEREIDSNFAVFFTIDLY